MIQVWTFYWPELCGASAASPPGRGLTCSPAGSRQAAHAAAGRAASRQVSHAAAGVDGSVLQVQLSVAGGTSGARMLV